MDAPPQAGRYRVIYADPPWRFATYSDKGKGRSAEAHYVIAASNASFAIPKGVKTGCGLPSASLQHVVAFWLGGH